MSVSDQSPSDVREFDGTFEATTRRQVLLGLELDATARLRWLEERMAELLRLKGAAKSE
jgi:hypothetical protein